MSDLQQPLPDDPAGPGDLRDSDLTVTVKADNAIRLTGKAHLEQVVANLTRTDADTAVVVLVDDAYHSTRGALLQVSWHPHCPYHLLSLTDPDVGGQQRER